MVYNTTIYFNLLVPVHIKACDKLILIFNSAIRMNSDIMSDG